MTAFLITVGISAGVFCLLALLYLLVLVRPRAGKPPNPALLCDYAHSRGLHGHGIPENSLAAFELACQKGFGIELDIQLSADGEVMVFHDSALDRMTGKEEKLKNLTAAELKTLSLAGTDQRIPTFSEVLSLVDGRVPLLVELKGEEMTLSLCPKAAELLRGYRGAYCIESFNPLLLRAMRRELPDVFYGQLYTNVCKERGKTTPLHILLTAMAFNFLARPDFIAYRSVYRHTLPVRLTTRFYKASPFVWTVRDREELELCNRNGEHPIFEQIDR